MLIIRRNTQIISISMEVRYDTRFGLPVYDENGELERYNIFGARILIRRDKDGKLYLYDIVRTKKETSKPQQ